MNLIILEYNWELFIIIEVLSVFSLILFGVFRYFLNKPRLSLIFIIVFLIFLLAEAGLGLYIFKLTGEFSSFQIIITIFLIYALTFGIVDFLRLDRWMRKHIGKLRNVNLLTEKDKQIIARNKNPKYLAKKYRISSFIHLIIFIVVQTIFILLGTETFTEAISYLTDFSWLDEGNPENSPYPNETIFTIGVIWSIIFIVDLIYSWSYTIFPNKKD